MRCARIRADGSGYYHCISRVIERRPIFDVRAKEKFRHIIRMLAAFCDIQVLTYAIMDTHWHLLVHVPERKDVPDDELIRRLAILYEPHVVTAFARQLKDYRDQGFHQAAETLKAQYTYRMYDVSEFMKTLKQRFSQWYNKGNSRSGPLWEQRFKSILVEGSEHAIWTMAAYIDLNPVRAGIVADPKDYRYCGYGEAMGGSKAAMAGLAMVVRAVGIDEPWWRLRDEYRKHLFVEGARKRHGCAAFSGAQTEEVLQANGRLPAGSVLLCRVRYFSDGLALGSREFIEGVFARYREQFGLRRVTGARPMRYADWGGLCTLRDLRLAPVSSSP